METAFKSTPAQGPLGSMSQTHSVFSNMFLSSTSVEQPREIAIAYNVFGVSYTTLTYISKEGFSCLDLDVLCQLFFTLAVLSARQKDPVELYMNAYTKIYIYQKYFRQLIISYDFFPDILNVILPSVFSSYISLSLSYLIRGPLFFHFPHQITSILFFLHLSPLFPIPGNGIFLFSWFLSLLLDILTAEDLQLRAQMKENM